MTAEHTMICAACGNAAREVSPRMLCVQCEYDYNVKIDVVFQESHRIMVEVAKAFEGVTEDRLTKKAESLAREFNDANPLAERGH